MSVLIAGIHTGIGKTVCSAVLCQALGYDYWKPVQAGTEETDSAFIRKNVSNPSTVVHPEAYILQKPASPHYAAELEGIKIEKEKIVLPSSSNEIIVETAGGLMSPFAIDFFNIDLATYLNLPVILVADNYLGSINHTLLSVEALKQRNISIKGIVFSGEEVASSRSFIMEYTQLPLLFSIPPFQKINQTVITDFAKSISITL